MKRIWTGVGLAWACGLLMFAGNETRAEVASGSYYADMSDLAPVWDITGNYQMDFTYSAYESCSFYFTVTQTVSGQLSGIGSYHYAYDDYDEGLYLDGEVVVSGTVKNAGPTTKVTLSFKIDGGGYIEMAYYGAYDLEFSESVNFGFILDPASKLLITDGAIGKAKFTLLDFNKRFSSKQEFWGTQIPLADTASYGWALGLNLTPTGNKYNGTATVLTQSGQTINYPVKGSYSPKKDVSTLTLKGGKAGNLSLTMATSGSTITILSAKGKLLGQAVNYRQP